MSVRARSLAATRRRSGVAYVGQAADLFAITEAQLQTEVVRLARSLGWGVTQSARRKELEQLAGFGVPPDPIDGLIYHPRYSLGSEPGWPDLTLIRRRDRRLIFAELKAEKGRVSERQVEVLDLLRVLETDPETTPAIGVFVWRPSDLASGHIAEVLR